MDATKIVTISLKLEDDMVRIITDTKGAHCDTGIDFNDGYPAGAYAVLKEVLGMMTIINWKRELERLIQEQE